MNKAKRSLVDDCVCLTPIPKTSRHWQHINCLTQFKEGYRYNVFIVEGLGRYYEIKAYRLVRARMFKHAMESGGSSG